MGELKIEIAFEKLGNFSQLSWLEISHRVADWESLIGKIVRDLSPSNLRGIYNRETDLVSPIGELSRHFLLRR